MQGNQADDFESLARRYWAAWGDMLRTAPTQAGMPGMGGMGAPQAAPGASAPWQQAMDWWAQLATGATPQANDAVGHFSRQAGQWYGRMQDVAARFAGQQASAADVARAWQEALGAAGGQPFPDMLRSLRGPGLQGLDPWVEAVAPWLQSMRDQGMSWLGMPAFGAGREHQERMQQLAAHLSEYQHASAAYAGLMVRAQQEAFPLFEARLAAQAESGRPLDSGRALFDAWIDAAEEAYAAIALSPEFSEVYGRLVNAQMRVRGGVQRMVEDASAQLGMPTRSELDGAHRKLARLEREVRRLRDALGRVQHRDGGSQAASRAQPGPDVATGSKAEATEKPQPQPQPKPKPKGESKDNRNGKPEGKPPARTSTSQAAKYTREARTGQPMSEAAPGNPATQPKKGRR